MAARLEMRKPVERCARSCSCNVACPRLTARRPTQARRPRALAQYAPSPFHPLAFPSPVCTIAYPTATEATPTGRSHHGGYVD
jgi:hypothetical protein